MDPSGLQERTKGLFPETLGVRFTAVSTEEICAELDVRPELCTVPGLLHGGVLMSLADTNHLFAHRAGISIHINYHLYSIVLYKLLTHQHHYQRNRHHTENRRNQYRR